MPETTPEITSETIRIRIIDTDNYSHFNTLTCTQTDSIERTRDKCGSMWDFCPLKLLLRADMEPSDDSSYSNVNELILTYTLFRFSPVSDERFYENATEILANYTSGPCEICQKRALDGLQKSQ